MVALMKPRPGTTDQTVQPARDTAPRLVAALDELGNEYGALGVALAAAELTDPDVLVNRLTREPTDEDQEPQEESPWPDRRPSIGRIVHYVSYGTPHGEYTTQCRAAVVSEIDYQGGDGGDPGIGADYRFVGLVVLNPQGMFFNRAVLYGPDNTPGTWHWPEYVEE